MKTDALTPREQEIAGLLHLSNAQIAAKLRVTLPTVRAHVNWILSKTGSRNRTEAALKHHGIALP